MKSFFDTRVVFGTTDRDSLRNNSLTESTVRTYAYQIVPVNTNPTCTALMVHGIKNHIASVTISVDLVFFWQCDSVSIADLSTGFCRASCCCMAVSSLS
jgi:hypothetical protein